MRRVAYIDCQRKLKQKDFMSAQKKQAALIIFLEDTNRDMIHNRLTDDLTRVEKNNLYRAFLEDTMYTCLSMNNVAVMVNYPSEVAREIVEEAIENLKHKLTPKKRKFIDSDDFVAVSSKGESQGERLRNAFGRAFRCDYSPVLLIGCVTPTLSRSVLQNAVRQLNKYDVVFGPTLEGSYYLIGLSSHERDLYAKIDWDDLNTALYSQMVSVAEDESLKWNELDLWYDLRQPEDFEFLVRDINFFRQVGDEKSASSTEEVLDEILKKIS